MEDKEQNIEGIIEDKWTEIARGGKKSLGLKLSELLVPGVLPYSTHMIGCRKNEVGGSYLSYVAIESHRVIMVGVAQVFGYTVGGTILYQYIGNMIQ